MWWRPRPGRLCTGIGRQSLPCRTTRGFCWADSGRPFSLDGASPEGGLEGCGAGCAAAMNRRNDNEPYSFHPGGANVLFADGHVGFVRESVQLSTLAAMATRAAGEVLADSNRSFKAVH